MNGPRIPSSEELNGREIDVATEHAARLLRLAAEHGEESELGRGFLRQHAKMKAYISNLRRHPLF